MEGRLAELNEGLGGSSGAASAVRVRKRGWDDVTGRLGVGNDLLLSTSGAMGTVAEPNLLQHPFEDTAEEFFRHPCRQRRRELPSD